MKNSKIRPFIAALLALVMVLSTFLVTGCSEEEPDDAEPAPVEEVASNPLTGQTEDEGFDANALNQRIVAFVVENAPDARPQWGLDDPEFSPDIVLQGEVEAGITRTLWLYADYNKLPEIIGPMRSARPPYIKFSELFDSIFIHWGQSASKGEYIGAKTVFRRDKVDHINEMTFNDTMGLYDRDHTRSVSMEHRGILYGAKVPEALKQEGFRAEPKDYTKLNFNKLPWLTSFTPADTVKVKYSDKASWDSTFWTYNNEDKKYHTSNLDNDFARDNLLILYDDTEYISKDNYQGQAGHTVTYCNYDLAGGKGYLCSQGTVKNIEWKVEDGKLVMTDLDATQAAIERAEEKAAEAAEAGEEAKDD
ncbi:MAG: DUF3048 domain-containing protein [Mogibacterium sp.]|nr:DUF3048 domain-containing protein [Mogibacterium sp.]